MSKSLPSFFVTKDKDIIFAIYFLPGRRKYIGFPKLLASEENTDTIINRLNYQKVLGHDQWFLHHSERMRKYLEYVPAFDSWLFCFPEKDLITEYHPLDYPIFKIEDGHNRLTNDIINSISRVAEIDKNKIGIDGSTLLGCYTKNSDIDLIVYGYDNAKKLAAKFKNLNNHNNNMRLYEEKDYPEILKRRRSIGYGNSDVTIIEQESRRFYGFIRNKRFSLINVLEDDDPRNIDISRKIRFQKIFEGEIRISDSLLGLVTPSMLYGSNHSGEKYRIEIINHYGINQARDSERFFVRGNIYRDIKSGENIIILTFWNQDVEQRFDLLSR